MTAPLYAEPGATWWPLLWGPGFALAGYLAELFAGIRTHTVMWLAAGVGLLGLTAVWVYARRRFLAVRVTGAELEQGRERVPIAQLAEVDDVGTPAGTRVLGGGWSVPRKSEELPVRLQDGTVVLAWARDAGALRSALRSAMRDCAA